MPNEIPNWTKRSSFSRHRSRPLKKLHPQQQRSRGNALRASLARVAEFPLRRELSAGGIIYRRRQGFEEIFFIKDPFGKWTFPKGHQEFGEQLVQTAIREIREETALTGLRLIAPLGRTAFRFRRQGVLIQKTVVFFLFEAPPDAKERLTGEGAIFEGKWVPRSRVFRVSSYKNSDRLLGRALRYMSQEHRPRLTSPVKPPAPTA